MAAATGLVLAAGSLFGTGSPASASPATPRTPDPHVATEVCEDMVRLEVEATINRPLAAPQTGKWVTPDKRYVCTYDVGGGTLVLRVDVQRNAKGARDAFRRARSRAGPSEQLHGIGELAFQAGDGTLFARKDQFLLRVDPSDLPDGLSKRDVALSAAVAVMACW